MASANAPESREAQIHKLARGQQRLHGVGRTAAGERDLGVDHASIGALLGLQLAGELVDYPSRLGFRTRAQIDARGRDARFRALGQPLGGRCRLPRFTRTSLRDERFAERDVLGDGATGSPPGVRAGNGTVVLIPRQ